MSGSAKRKRIPRIVLAVVGSGAVVLGVAGFILRERIVERWHLWRFESQDAEVRADAAAVLADRGSVVAIPVFLRRIMEARDEDGRVVLRPDAEQIESIRFFGGQPRPPGLPVAVPPAEARDPSRVRGREDFSEIVDPGASLTYGTDIFCFPDAVPLTLDLIELVRNAGERAVPALQDCLRIESEDSYERYLAMCLLGNLGVQARGAYPDIREVVLDIEITVPRGRPDYRVEASEALPRIVRADDTALIRELVDLACSWEFSTRVAGTRALQKIGAACLPDVRDRLRAGSAEDRLAVMRLLVHLGEVAEPAVPDIAGFLDSADLEERRSAVESLWNLGPLAKAALPALEKHRDDEVIGKIVEQAIERISPRPAPKFKPSGGPFQ